MYRIQYRHPGKGICEFREFSKKTWMNEVPLLSAAQAYMDAEAESFPEFEYRIQARTSQRYRDTWETVSEYKPKCPEVKRFRVVYLVNQKHNFWKVAAGGGATYTTLAEALAYVTKRAKVVTSSDEYKIQQWVGGNGYDIGAWIDVDKCPDKPAPEKKTMKVGDIQKRLASLTERLRGSCTNITEYNRVSRAAEIIKDAEELLKLDAALQQEVEV